MFAWATLAAFFLSGYDTAAVAPVARAEAIVGDKPANSGLELRRIVLGGETLEVEIADTPAKRALGLSNRESLPDGGGMLFVYPDEGKRSLWMKDMRFALDMLWFDSGRILVHVERDVAPETYPESFVSPEPAQYVLELPAGYVSRAGLVPGVSFVWK